MPLGQIKALIKHAEFCLGVATKLIRLCLNSV